MNGEENRFADIFERCGDTVCRLALVRLQSREDAEDVLQETFYRLLKERQWQKWDEEHVKAWLIKVAVNCCRDLGRKRVKESSLTEKEMLLLTGPIPRRDLELWELVNQLGEPDRTVLHMFYVEEIPLKECAKVLGLSYPNARVIIHRARKKLRRALEEGETS